MNKKIDYSNNTYTNFMRSIWRNRNYKTDRIILNVFIWRMFKLVVPAVIIVLNHFSQFDSLLMCFVCIYFHLGLMLIFQYCKIVISFGRSYQNVISSFRFAIDVSFRTFDPFKILANGKCEVIVFFLFLWKKKLAEMKKKNGFTLDGHSGQFTLVNTHWRVNTIVTLFHCLLKTIAAIRWEICKRKRQSPNNGISVPMSRCMSANSFLHFSLLSLFYRFDSILYVTNHSVNSKSRQWRSCFCFHWYTSWVQRFLSAPFFSLLFVVDLLMKFFLLLFVSILFLVVSHEFYFCVFSSSNFLCPCIIFSSVKLYMNSINNNKIQVLKMVKSKTLNLILMYACFCLSFRFRQNSKWCKKMQLGVKIRLFCLLKL